LATFTDDLSRAVHNYLPLAQCPIVAMTDRGSTYEYPDDVLVEVGEEKLDDYIKAAHVLNDLGVDALLVQHEFGIFGGAAGDYVLEMLRRLECPVISTLHTVLQHPNDEQRRVVEELDRVSARFVVMTDKAAELLAQANGIAPGRVSVIPHGVPARHCDPKEILKRRLGLEGRRTILTFGLISEDKGIEEMIRALPLIAARYPDVLYIVVGATHPKIVEQHGEIYRERLELLSRELGVESNVRFVNRYTALDELVEYLAAVDLYITPYRKEEQVTSGTLAYAIGAGRAVLSTPYWHATELLGDGTGVLVPFRDSDEMAKACVTLFANPGKMAHLEERARRKGNQMSWPRVAAKYVDLVKQTVQTPTKHFAPPQAISARVVVI